MSGDSTVPLQISETPMHRKNQEMRKNAEKRTSFSQRGARASASFGKGEASEYTVVALAWTAYVWCDTGKFDVVGTGVLQEARSSKLACG